MMTRGKVFLFAAFALVLTFAFAPRAQAAPPGPDIVETAVAVNSEGDFAGQFDILIAAVTAAPEVAATLSGNGQYTVFAPTDDAFAAAFAELGVTPEQVLADTELLTTILTYHVAPGRRNSNAVIGSSRIRTLEGTFLFQSGGVLTDNVGRTANIVVTDVPASNGIIHAIDAVVLPALP